MSRVGVPMPIPILGICQHHYTRLILGKSGTWFSSPALLRLEVLCAWQRVSPLLTPWSGKLEVLFKSLSVAFPKRTTPSYLVMSAALIPAEVTTIV
jgi:hypothetical protein